MRTWLDDRLPVVIPTGCEVTRIGVVVPVHNEQELLPGCVAALRTAAAVVEAGGVEVHLLVVLEACTDRSAESVGNTPVLAVSHRNLGAARRAGADTLLRRLGTSQTWPASTDADSVVPPCWLADQLAHAHARAGVDAVGDGQRLRLERAPHHDR